MTLAGASLTVTSSTVLYVNFILAMVSKESTVYWTSPWMNVFVFGKNLNSVLNDIGLLLLSDIPMRAFKWSLQTAALDRCLQNTTRLLSPSRSRAAVAPQKIVPLPHHEASSGVIALSFSALLSTPCP